MPNPTKYFILNSNGFFINWHSDILGLETEGQALEASGSFNDDSVYVGKNTFVDASRLTQSSGQDSIYLTGNFADYTESNSGPIYTLTKSVNNAIVESLIFTSSNRDILYFADGFINIGRNTLIATPKLSAQTFHTSKTTPDSLDSIPEIAEGGATLAFITDASGANIPSAIKGSKLTVYGSFGSDTVYVAKGTQVNAVSLTQTPGNDVIYLTGNFADYNESHSGPVYTLVAKDKFDGLTESVTFSASNGDKLYFADGYIEIGRNKLDNGSVALKDAVFNTDKSTPGLGIGLVISDDKDNTVKMGDVITYTFTFNEAVKDFTIDDININNASVKTGASLVPYTSGENKDKVYTLEITPNANAQGDIVVSVDKDAANALTGDLKSGAANNSNSFDTIAPTPEVGFKVSAKIDGSYVFIKYDAVSIELVMNEEINTSAATDANKITIHDIDFILDKSTSTGKKLIFTHVVVFGDNIDYDDFDIDSPSDINLSGITDMAGNAINLDSMGYPIELGTGINQNIALSNKGLANLTISSGIDFIGEKSRNVNAISDGVTRSDNTGFNYAVNLDDASGQHFLFDFKGADYINGSFKLHGSVGQPTVGNSTIEFLHNGGIVATHIIKNPGDIVVFTPAANIVFDQVKLTFNNKRQYFREIEVFGSSIAAIDAAISLVYDDNFSEAIDSDDGTVAGSMTIEVLNDTFLGDDNAVIDASHYEVTSVPAGLTLVVTKIDSTHAVATFTGRATHHTNSNDLSNIGISFKATAFTLATDASIINDKTDIAIDFTALDLTYSAGNFIETTSNNDGAVSGSMEITLDQDTFVGDNNTAMDVNSYSASNVPNGLTLVVTKKDDTHAIVSFTGKAENHAHSNAVNGINITFTAAAFTNTTDIALIGNNSGSNIAIDFNDAPVITQSGATGSAIFDSTITVTDTGGLNNLSVNFNAAITEGTFFNITTNDKISLSADNKSVLYENKIVGSIQVIPTYSQNNQVSITNGNTITKTGVYSSWTSGGDTFSANSIANNGFVSAQSGATDNRLMFGLSNSNDNNSYNYINIDYAIYFRSDNKIEIYEKGNEKGVKFDKYSTTDVFSVERNGDTITYLKNDEVFYTSQTKTTDTLYFETAFHSVGDSLTNVLMGSSENEGNIVISFKDQTDQTSINAIINAVTYNGSDQDINVNVLDKYGVSSNTITKTNFTDTVAPMVNDVVISGSTDESGANAKNTLLILGDYVVVTVTMSENVVVTGDPIYKLMLGNDQKTAIYKSGSGTNTLIFTYAIEAGDIDHANGITATTTALEISDTDTIKDISSMHTNANLATHEVAVDSNSVTIDTTATLVADSINITATNDDDNNFETVIQKQSITATLSKLLLANQSVEYRIDSGTWVTVQDAQINDKAIVINNTNLAEATTAVTQQKIEFRLTDTSGNKWSISSQNYVLTIPTLIYTFSGGEEFKEPDSNDGSVTGKISITLQNDTFAGADTAVIDPNNYDVNNVPSGLSLVVTKTDATHAHITFTGTANNNSNLDDLNNIGITFKSDAFTLTEDASTIATSNKADIAIDFISATPVITEGGDSAAGSLFNKVLTITDADTVKDMSLTFKAASSTFTLASKSTFTLASKSSFTVDGKDIKVGTDIVGTMQSTFTPIFSNINGIEITGNTLKKIGAGDAWNNGDTYSTSSITSDGFASSQAGQTNKNIMFGLSNSIGNDTSNYKDIDYALYITNAQRIEIYEQGTKKHTMNESYSTSDVFSVQRTGDTVSYYKNNVFIYESATKTTDTLYLETAFLHNGGILNNVLMSDANDFGKENISITFNDNAALTPAIVNDIANAVASSNLKSAVTLTVTDNENLSTQLFQDPTGSGGDDVLTGDMRDNTINALAGNDTLIGLAGNDTLIGGEGDDKITGGAGNDALTGGTGADTFIYVADNGEDTISDFSISDGDKLDLKAFITVKSGDVIGDYLTASVNGDDAQLIIDSNGSDTGGNILNIIITQGGSLVSQDGQITMTFSNFIIE